MGRSLSLAAYLAFKRDPVPVDTSHWSKRQNGTLIWIHIHEKSSQNAVVDLAKRLHHDDDALHFLITAPFDVFIEEVFIETTTLNASSLKSANLFFDHWMPNIAIWVTGHLKPAFVYASEKRGIPQILLDATVDGFDGPAANNFTNFQTSLLGRFARVLAANEDAIAKLRKLGAIEDRLSLSGELNDSAPVLSCDEMERDALADQLAGRSVWLVNSCVEQEIKMVISAHKRGMRSAHRMLMVIVTDDHELAERVQIATLNAGLETLRTTDMKAIDAFTQVFIADEPEDLGLWYRLATLTFVGGTLSGQALRNPFEAAALGSAILFGPDTGAFPQEFSRLEKAGAAKKIRNPVELGQAVERYISPDKAAEMAHAAWDESTKGAETTDFVKEVVFETLETSEAL